jgi:hypothetical protein
MEASSGTESEEVSSGVDGAGEEPREEHVDGEGVSDHPGYSYADDSKQPGKMLLKKVVVSIGEGKSTCSLEKNEVVG